MTRALTLLLFLAAAVAAALWLAAQPEEVEIAVGVWRARMPATVAGLFVAIALLLAGLLALLLRWFGSRPRALRGWAARRRRGRADRAVEQALIALSAGRHRQALREAERAGRLLGQPTLTLWLTAQAAQAAGEGATAEAALRQLAVRPAAAVIGLRGLAAREAEAGHTEAARALLAEATATDPRAVALKSIEAELAARAQDWRAALAHARSIPQDERSRHRHAELALAVAEAESGEEAKLAHLKEAFRADPTFAPGAAAYARTLLAGGWRRRGRRVLRDAWRANPHPLIAAVALTPIGREGPRHVLDRVRNLMGERAEHTESRVMLARAALDAEDWAEARRQLGAAIASGSADRRVHLLRAELAERDGSDREAARAAYREAGEAPGEPAWRCSRCAAVHKEWAPVCDSCGATLSFDWSATPRASRTPAIATVHAPDTAGTSMPGTSSPDATVAAT